MFSKRNRFVAIIILIASMGLFLTACGDKAATDAVQEESKIPVSIETIKKGALEKKITLGGLLQPQDETSLASKNPAAKVVAISAQKGDYVQAGTPLVIFDSRDIDLQLSQAQLNYERNKQLFDVGAISQYQLEQLETGLENLRIQKESTVLSSPINGIVTAVTAQEGQLAGGGPLVSVVNIDRLKLELQVGESNINKLKGGDKMEAWVPAVSQEPFTGVITNIAPHIDARTKAYPVTMELANEEGLIKGGMYGEVQLITDRKEDVIIIPQFAILDYEQKKVVYVVEDDKAKMKEIKVGLTLGERAEILAGLTEGEALVVKGQYGIKEGTPVTPMGGENK